MKGGQAPFMHEIAFTPQRSGMYSTIRTMRTITLLGYALLGLLHGKESSGYELRKVFAETPMGGFSDSPGAIYPALKRLETWKLIAVRPTSKSSLRRRRNLELTREGREALKLWLEMPLGEADVASHLRTIMLKFAFMETVIGKSATLSFLYSLQKELQEYVPRLAHFLESQSCRLPRSGRLALESGLRGYLAQVQWVSYAICAYEGDKE
jgi:DNA-binding PadR family transcriptional regulator